MCGASVSGYECVESVCCEHVSGASVCEWCECASECECVVWNECVCMSVRVCVYVSVSFEQCFVYTQETG